MFIAKKTYRITRPDLVCLVGIFLFAKSIVFAQGNDDRSELRKPIHRVAKRPDANLDSQSAPSKDANLQPDAATTEAHPMDRALEIARQTLAFIDNHVQDYSCIMVKRERINGNLLEHEFMKCKVRHAQSNGDAESPFSVYLGFRKPDTVKGREVIYVDGRNSGKLIAHEGGLRGRLIPTVELAPDSILAMRNNKYPITEIGIRTLTQRLIEKGERDKKLGPCSVKILKGAKVKDRVCTCIEVKHADRKPQYDFYVARIFLDDKLQVPIRYEAYDWPTSKGSKPRLLEEYTYINLKLNVGLTMQDFDRNNPNYNF